MMIRGKDIIIVGQQPWDVEIGSNCKDIALELSNYNRILYVNAPLDRITKIRSKKDPKIRKRIHIIKNKENSLEQIHNNLWVLYPDVLLESINWIRLSSLFSFFNLINNRKFSKAILRAVDKLKFTNYLLFNDNDIFRSFYLKELLKPVLSIYYIRDNMVATPYWRRHGKKLEPKLIAKSDLVLSNSEYLRIYSAKYNKNSYFVAQGCDFELLNKSDLTQPEDLNGIITPIIGYFGALTALRLDIDLIQCIAESFPKCSLVLVGPEDEVFRESFLHTFKNVFFLGKKVPNEIFKYINHFDVCINPQLVNDLTVGNYPRKIDEYLALGKPIVATLTDTMEMFREYVYLAKDSQMFVEMIGRALSEDCIRKENQRKDFAFSHNWENAVNAISENIEKYLPNENRAFDYDT